MSQHIQAIYENGILRPLAPLNLAENSVVEIDVREVIENSAETPPQKAVRVLREARLISPLNFPVTEADILSEEERTRMGKLFSVGKPLSEIIIEEREERG